MLCQEGHSVSGSQQDLCGFVTMTVYSKVQAMAKYPHHNPLGSRRLTWIVKAIIPWRYNPCTIMNRNISGSMFCPWGDWGPCYSQGVAMFHPPSYINVHFAREENHPLLICSIIQSHAAMKSTRNLVESTFGMPKIGFWNMRCRVGCWSTFKRKKYSYPLPAVRITTSPTGGHLFPAVLLQGEVKEVRQEEDVSRETERRGLCGTQICHDMLSDYWFIA